MEMNFPARAAFEEMSAKIMADPTLSKLVAEDEARYIDRASAVHYRAEMSASTLKQLASAA